MNNNSLTQFPASPKGKSGWPWNSNFLSINTNNHDKLPKISVITPSFNQGEYIEETIRSVLLQNYPNLQYIIIDGGSTDSTIKIINKYNHLLDYWVSEKDRGQSHAINKGLEIADGDILCWLNSDDLLKPGALDFVSKSLTTSKPAWLVGSTDITNHKRKRLFTKRTKEKVTIENFRFWNLYWIPQQSTFWNRQIQNKVGLLNENLHYALDVDFLFRLYLITPPSVFKEILAEYRFQGHAKSKANEIDSIRETAEWTFENIISSSNTENQIITYIENSIKLQKILLRVKRHIVFGSIINFWAKYVNKNFDFFSDIS